MRSHVDLPIWTLNSSCFIRISRKERLKQKPFLNSFRESNLYCRVPPRSRLLQQAVQAEGPHRSGTANVLKLLSCKSPREALYIPLAWLRTAGNDLYWSVARNDWHSCRASVWQQFPLRQVPPGMWRTCGVGLLQKQSCCRAQVIQSVKTHSNSHSAATFFFFWLVTKMANPNKWEKKVKAQHQNYFDLCFF